MFKKPRRVALILRAIVMAPVLLFIISCGTSTKFDEFIPSRILSVGDQLSYLGQDPNNPPYVNQYSSTSPDRFGVNYTSNIAGITPNSANIDTTYINNWVLQVAIGYGISTTSGVRTYVPSGLAWDTPVTVNPSSNPNSISAQINLAIRDYRPGDMLLVNAGMSFILDQAKQVLNGKSLAQAVSDTQTEAQNLMAVLAQAKRAGINNIVVLTTYDPQYSPYALDNSNGTTLQSLSLAFNNGFKTASTNPSYVDVLYHQSTGIIAVEVDTNLNILTSQAQYGYAVQPGCFIANGSATYSNVNTNTYNHGALCTLDPTNSDGTAAPYTASFFADNYYLTPAGQQYVGNFVYTSLRGYRGW
jgi:hypothetical protein